MTKSDGKTNQISNRSIKTGRSEKPPKYEKSNFWVFGPRLCRKFRAFIWRKSGVDPRSLRGVRAIFVNLVFFSPVVFLVVWKTWVAKIVHYLETHSPRLGKCKKMGQLGDPIKQNTEERFLFPLCTWKYPTICTQNMPNIPPPSSGFSFS